MKRTLGAAISVLVLTAGLATPAHAATDVLPDLGSGGLSDFRIEVTSTGEKRLRFTSKIINKGRGPFEVYAKRPNTTTATMTVSQRVHNTAGGYRRIEVTGTHAFYSGDGHNHWHVKGMQSFEIPKLNSDGTEGPIAGSGAKTGFCFFDNTVYKLTLPGAPQSPRYRSCGTQSSLAIKVGVSVGWADTYGASLPYQWIKINGLPDGKYKVRVRTDPKNWFTESVESNNSISTTVRITGNSVVRVVA